MCVCVCARARACAGGGSEGAAPLGSPTGAEVTAHPAGPGRALTHYRRRGAHGNGNDFIIISKIIIIIIIMVFVLLLNTT